MKVLVTGGSGGLGRYVLRALEGKADVYAPSKRVYDITNEYGPADLFITPDVVVHLAALTDTDLCSRKPEQAVEINALGTAKLARECREVRARLVYMSTDAVFHGVEFARTEPHDEARTPAADSVYGWSKFAGEQAVMTLGAKGLVVRANFFTRHCRGKRSFAEYVVQSASSKRSFGCYEHVVSTPVFAKTLAERIVQAVFEGEHGVLHVASSDSSNRVEQARMICEAYGLPTSGIINHPNMWSNGRLSAPRGTCSTVREEIEKMAKEEPL